MTSSVTLTAAEAAAVHGLNRSHVTRLARRGVVDGVLVDRVWLIDGQSLTEYLSRPRGRWVRDRLPAEPLLRQVELRGGDAACGVEQHSREEKALERARETGWVTEPMADVLAVRLLGLTPWELWDLAA